MLLCDKCDRGHHIYCLRPILKIIPEGEWFCPECRPKDIVNTARKIRKTFVEQENEIYSDEDDVGNTKIDVLNDDNEKTIKR
jgi:bromodomain adjacent to zinc finger domain protein 1A